MALYVVLMGLGVKRGMNDVRERACGESNVCRTDNCGISLKLREPVPTRYKHKGHENSKYDSKLDVTPDW